MIRVAVETSTSHGSVAVGRGERLLAEVTLGVQRRHAETSLPALESALELAGVGRADVAAVVVGSGPGSFTGVRVAGAMAKGLVAALDVPLLAYPSLLALAAGVPADGPVCGLFDARREEVYAGCWAVTPSSLEELLSPRVGPVESVLQALREAEDPGSTVGTAGPAGTAGPVSTPLFVGDGALRYRTVLQAAGARIGVAPARPRAATLLWLAEHHPGAGVVADVAAWEPLYVRASSAERGIAG